MESVTDALNDVLRLLDATRTAYEIRQRLDLELQAALEGAQADDVELVRQVIEQSKRKGRWPLILVERMRWRVGVSNSETENANA